MALLETRESFWSRIRVVMGSMNVIIKSMPVFFSSLSLFCLGYSIRLGLEKWRFRGEIYKFSVHLTFAGDTRKGFEFGEEEEEEKTNE